MLHEGILHKCIKQLLEKKKNVPVKDMAEDLECLCQIIRTVGRRLDTPKAKVSLSYGFCSHLHIFYNKFICINILFTLTNFKIYYKGLDGSVLWANQELRC